MRSTTVKCQHCGELFGHRCVEAASLEGLRALRDAVHDYLWSEPEVGPDHYDHPRVRRDRALARMMKAHDAATAALAAKDPSNE